MRKEIHFLKDGTNELRFVFDDFVGFTVPCEDGRLLAGVGRTLTLLDPESQGETQFAHVDEKWPDNRFNDGKRSPEGRLWAGTMNNILNENEDMPLATGSLYRVDGTGAPLQVIQNCLIPNGMAFDLKRNIFYHTDTMTSRIDAYDYDEKTGRISHLREALRVDTAIGWPDGFTIDDGGMLGNPLGRRRRIPV